MVLNAIEADGLPKPAYEDEGIGLTLKFLTHLPPQLNETPGKTREKTREKILSLISEDPHISTAELAEVIGITQKGIDWQMTKLKKEGLLKRIGPAKGGHWKVIQS